ncbi:hypothetical protein BLA29_014658, partial [Euroglyphus maynei]
MARLLSGKKPLRNSRSHHGKEQLVNQVSRAQFNQCVYPGSNIQFRRINTFASLPVHDQQPEDAKNTDSNSQLNRKPTC